MYLAEDNCLVHMKYLAGSC